MNTAPKRDRFTDLVGVMTIVGVVFSMLGAGGMWAWTESQKGRVAGSKDARPVADDADALRRRLATLDARRAELKARLGRLLRKAPPMRVVDAKSPPSEAAGPTRNIKLLSERWHSAFGDLPSDLHRVRVTSGRACWKRPTDTSDSLERELGASHRGELARGRDVTLRGPFQLRLLRTTGSLNATIQVTALK